MTQIVLNVEDTSLIPSLKQILGAIKGITIDNPLKKKDPTSFSKEDFYARIDEAKKGPSYELKEGETLEDLIERVG